MRSRISLGIAALLLVAVSVGAGFYLGFGYGTRQPKNIVVQGVANINPNKNPDADFGIFWQAWQKLKEEHLKSAELKDQDLVYGAIRGLVNSLSDPYTEFFSPQDSKKFNEDIQGKFGGVGMEIGKRDDQLVVVAPLKNTPAERAGLRSGDKIFQINDDDTTGLDVTAAVNKIRGDVGTVVKLQIFRSGWDKAREFSITREIIQVPTLDFEMKGDIAYIQLHGFNDNADTLFYNAIVKAANANAHGIVLDLRNDPGGYLEVAVDLAGWFVPQNKLVVTEAYADNRKPEVFYAKGNQALLKVPTVVIVNGGSASASEILAGALRDIRGIKLVGEKSFGKGTVQQIFNLKDKSTIKITVAHWVLPSGKIIDKNGLEPDIKAALTEDDVKAKRDPQLDAALKEVKEEIKAE